MPKINFISLPKKLVNMEVSKNYTHTNSLVASTKHDILQKYNLSNQTSNSKVNISIDDISLNVVSNLIILVF